MTLLTVGLSYRSAPVSVLEKVAIRPSDVPKLLDELAGSESITEVLMISTCNRVEIYADVSRFHPAVAEVSGVLARVGGLDLAALGEHLYVHFDDAAAEHMFRVASGLDSMVVGESQILGQLRDAYATGTESATVGRVLHDLVQSALRTGKSVHHDTGIDRAGASIVSVALDRAAEIHRDERLREEQWADRDERLGEERWASGLAGKRVMVIGAGSMGALAAATAHRHGVGEIVVTNRTAATATRVATAVGGRAVPIDDHAAVLGEIAQADVLISCTGATGIVLDRDDFGDRSTRPLVILDLALPRDVDPSVAELPGVHYVDLSALRDAGAMVSDTEVAAAAAIVAERLRVYLDEQQMLAVAPTVTALRARASQVVDSELRRLEGRVPDLDPRSRREVEAAVRRAVDKVLHAPTVRVKELAATPDGDKYAAALRALFDLDPAVVETAAAVQLDNAANQPLHRQVRRRPAGPVMTTVSTLRVGTRASLLARTQTDWVIAALGRTIGAPAVEVVTISTEGDRSTAALAQIGGTGVFVSALRDALLAGDIDVAVHSYKDLPTAAVPTAWSSRPCRRARTPRDALVARDNLTLGELPAGSRVGTGSPRRAAQIRALGMGLELVAIRGNVDTRLKKVASGELDAVVLAQAGLRRIGRIDEAHHRDPRPVAGAAGPGSGRARDRVPQRRRRHPHGAGAARMTSTRARRWRPNGPC